jgi:hypothetical protein
MSSRFPYRDPEDYRDLVVCVSGYSVFKANRSTSVDAEEGAP